jgi:spore coat protein U-like protein
LPRTRRRPVWIATCVALAGLGLSGPALAVMDCSVSTAGLGFGEYDPLLATPNDSTANVAVTCTRQIFVDPFNISYTLRLSRGSSGSYAQRRMNAGPAQLNYNLYRDAGRSQIWGDGTSSTATVAGTANFVWFQTSQTNNHTIYGRAPAQQNAAPGNYTDTIVLTITF